MRFLKARYRQGKCFLGAGVPAWAGNIYLVMQILLGEQLLFYGSSYSFEIIFPPSFRL